MPRRRGGSSVGRPPRRPRAAVRAAAPATSRDRSPGGRAVRARGRRRAPDPHRGGAVDGRRGPAVRDENAQRGRPVIGSAVQDRRAAYGSSLSIRHGSPRVPLPRDSGRGRRERAAARRTLRAQIALLERELAEAFVTAFAMGGLGDPARHRRTSPGCSTSVSSSSFATSSPAAPRRASRRRRPRRRAGANRDLLARMQLEPGSYRFTRISCRELGEPGCGVWQVRPRLGLVGMLMGWWQVKLSSGCPLAQGPSSAPGADAVPRSDPSQPP